MIRTECCGKTVSRTREDGRFAYFICWTCNAVQRIRLHYVPGAEGVNESSLPREQRFAALDEKA